MTAKQSKNEFVKNFDDRFIYGKLKDKLIKDGFIYRCPFCLDVSHQYGRSLNSYQKH